MWILFKKLIGLFLFLDVFMSPSILFSQVPVKDHVTDTVWCLNMAGQSYALYLPAQYDNNKKFPLILIFDPGARGRTGINAFIEAGRKYGFILACSNNSRNGPVGDNFISAAAILQDILKRYNIDQRRIYAAGFSGGSRFAAALAVMEKKISGVIGCGAGVLNDKKYLPSESSGFFYFGMAGTRDMNYLEMRDLIDYFSYNTRVISYFRSFSGGHQWPGPDLITEAVEWLILQAMNRGEIPADQNFLAYIENKTQNLISTRMSDGNMVDAIMYMKFASRDFKGTPFASSISKMMNDSEKSKEYHNAIRKWNKMTESEKQKRETYINYLSKILDSGSVPDSAAIWWNNEISTLLRLCDKGNPENSQMASRILNFISIMCYEQGALYYRNRFFSQAAFLFAICTKSDSGNQSNYYNLARALAGQGKASESVDALYAAVNHGFNSRLTVESDPVFVKIRNDPKFKALILKMK
jgi:hypothetical protein